MRLQIEYKTCPFFFFFPLPTTAEDELVQMKASYEKKLVLLNVALKKQVNKEKRKIEEQEENFKSQLKLFKKKQKLGEQTFHNELLLIETKLKDINERDQDVGNNGGNDGRDEIIPVINEWT